MLKSTVLALLFYTLSFSVIAEKRSWVKNEQLTNQEKSNPLNLNQKEFIEKNDAGIISSLKYPVKTGVHFPFKPFNEMFSSKTLNPITRLVRKALKALTQSNSLMGLQERLGLVSYPEFSTELESSPYYIPRDHEFNIDQQKMGFTIQDVNSTKAFSISCAQCHTENLFGKAVIGLSNRFPRPNQFFIQIKSFFDNFPLASLKLATSFTKDEYNLLIDAKDKLQFVGAKTPITLGLDTSLAQVALSLASRNDDPHASRPANPINNNEHPLNQIVGDSKPTVWWNVKYKNKWLADGSVVSGNPILTNILWNEIGRGADLTELESWLSSNSRVIDELTTAVFSNQAPRMEDFIGVDYFSDIERLKEGQTTYRQSCARCHGTYQKGWNESEEQSLYKLIKTVKVNYSENIDAIDVGTDPNRYQAMEYLLPLNKLSFSIQNNIKIEHKKGYVPPPMVGIWSRWPYMHNNSLPNLCELLKISSKRTKHYMAREANNIETDFNLNCNGYPEAPINANSDYYFNSEKPGLSNTGHDVGILIDRNGEELLSEDKKQNLIYYLQTL